MKSYILPGLCLVVTITTQQSVESNSVFTHPRWMHGVGCDRQRIYTAIKVTLAHGTLLAGGST